MSHKPCKKCGILKLKSVRCPNCLIVWRENHYSNLDNKEKIKLYHRNWYAINKERILQEIKTNPEKKETKRLRDNKRQQKLRNEDPAFKLRKNFSRIVNHVLKGNKNGKSIKKYLPYTFEELKIHLESQFDEKMNWQNYGSYWHVDHIYPQSALPYVSMEEENFKKCWALENLRPLEAIANIKKSNKIEKVTL